MVESLWFVRRCIFLYSHTKSKIYLCFAFSPSPSLSPISFTVFAIAQRYILTYRQTSAVIYTLKAKRFTGRLIVMLKSTQQNKTNKFCLQTNEWSELGNLSLSRIYISIFFSSQMLFISLSPF